MASMKKQKNKRYWRQQKYYSSWQMSGNEKAEMSMNIIEYIQESTTKNKRLKRVMDGGEICGN